MTHISAPTEPYYNALPDHNWHNDLTYDQLPDWIKGNSKYANLLLGGKQVVGKNVCYQIKHGKLMRRLRNHIIPVQQQRRNNGKSKDDNRRSAMTQQNKDVPMFTTPKTTKGTGLIGRITGREEAASLRNTYQTELDNANAALVNEIHHTEGVNRRKALDYYHQAQALKEDIKVRQAERKALVDALDAQIEKERGHEYEMWKQSPQGLRINTTEGLKTEVSQAGLGVVGTITPAPVLKYLEQYPKSAATSFVIEIIGKIESKEGEIRKKAEAHNQSVASFNHELPFYEKNVLKCEENLRRYNKILKEGTDKINGCRYVKSPAFKMLSQKEKDGILLQTLPHTIEKWERIIELFRNDLIQWQKQSFTELSYS